ncbi:hypothetical protein GFS24_27350 [Chitinophaga sp. SYP-B3965]|uniref:discoidin domain-containing protein n=1 Tax=Chitinophaga sp. SYP-B3965 TaxID=2663120 RepID=UPI001299B559|nr:discoidin domain-containing protein [Chitinophaga sp. SYP-B3965]MRG48857.1 hypothetical protein [Chitinophaga sp. SYP-B3965]
MKYVVALLILVCGLFACNQIPPDVEKVLVLAENNRSELEKVITHFKHDPEKYKAALFLIGNMDGQYSYQGEMVEHFKAIFDVLDSLHRNNIKVPITSPILLHAWDSLVAAEGSTPQAQDAEIARDHQTLSAAYLIQHIDWSFKVWKESPWCKNLSFEQFCEYLLPYRASHETPEIFHERLRKRFGTLQDTSKANNSCDFTDQFNKQVRAFASVSNTMRLYPFDFSISQMEKGRRGSCAHLSQYEVMALRANGVPAAIDYTPMWGDLNRGHQWDVLLQENGTCYAFDAAASGFGGVYNYPYRFSKVFRKTFATQHPIDTPSIHEVPAMLLNNKQRDVTEEYTLVSDLEIPLTIDFEIPRDYAVICTFNTKSWSAQSYGPVKNKKATFTKMGRNLLYIVMYYYQGTYYPATKPFILQNSGSIQYLQHTPPHQEMQLLRKYPRFIGTLNYMSAMVGGRFQGANKQDFSDSVNLFTVTEVPEKIETALISQQQLFRYVRFIAPHGIRTNVAELKFFQGATQLFGKTIGFPDVSQEETGTGLINVSDGDPATYFSGIKDSISWAGLDLGKPKKITRIRYCPRSDTNFILEGDTYELRYWDGEKWVVAGKQTATEQRLLFKDVPAGTVYILHDLSKGNEERIFTYENGKQVWW